MADSIDEEIEDINERLEKLVEEMSNTKSVHLLNALNNYPIIRFTLTCVLSVIIVEYGLWIVGADRIVLLLSHLGIPYPVE